VPTIEPLPRVGGIFESGLSRKRRSRIMGLL
jgi:hypothetical protein